jgi:tetratricopeptide (TPR) repeat protein
LSMERVIVPRFQFGLRVGVVLCCLMSALLAQPDSPTVELEVEPFVPARPRDEADEDRILSEAMFSQGRLLFQRDRPDEALRYYQRAYRFSNGSQTVLHEIVQLAFRLGRLDEAARYALRASPTTALDPFVLRRLALHLTDRQQFDQAVQLYERTLTEGASGEEPSEALVITRFEMGRLYFLSQQFEPAAKAFETLLPMLPKSADDPVDPPVVQALLQDAPLTFAVMGETFLRAGQPERAADMFSRAYPTTEQASLRAFHMARIAEEAQRPEEALQQLEIYFQAPERSTGVTPFRLLKWALGQQDRGDELPSRLVDLRSNDAENPSLTYALAEAQLAAGDDKEATQLFEQLLLAQPSVDADRGLVRIALKQRQAGLLLRRLGDAVARAGGLEPLAETVKPIPQDPTLWPELMQAAREQHAASDPEAAVRTLAVAQIALQAEQFEVADEFYALAAGEPPQIDPSIGSRWALDMLSAGRSQRAARLLQNLIDLQPPAEQRGELLFYLSGALALQEQYTEALAAAQQAAQLLPEIPSAEMRPAWVLYLARRWPEAQSAYQAFLEKFAAQYGSNAVRDSVREAKLTLSNICVLQQQHTEAEEWLEQVLDEFPEDVGAMNDLGYLWADRQVHLRRALQMVHQAVEAEPDNYAYRDSYGWALYRLGRYDEAVQQLRRAADTEDETDGVILDHLGDALERTGDLAGARSAWQRALQHLPPAEDGRRQLIETKLEQFRPE